MQMNSASSSIGLTRRGHPMSDCCLRLSRQEEIVRNSCFVKENPASEQLGFTESVTMVTDPYLSGYLSSKKMSFP